MSLVAAFNGGFKMADAHGGYYTEGQVSPRGPAAPSNDSKLLATTQQGPWTFFEPRWARDFITMSARPGGPVTG